MEEVHLGGENSFIGAWYISDLKACDDLIQYFKQADQKEVGKIFFGPKKEINTRIKDSVDLLIPPNDFSRLPVRKYIVNLMGVVQKYIEKYPAANAVNAWALTENINIQYYRPAGGYKEWHCERLGKMLPSVNRHLVFMTYLNDVSDEGGTEFSHQKIKVQPRKGLTLIWPADWTHLHRGVVSRTEEKYIITGWFDFL
jgi:hypothetical protein